MIEECVLVGRFWRPFYNIEESSSDPSRRLLNSASCIYLADNLFYLSRVSTGLVLSAGWSLVLEACQNQPDEESYAIGSGEQAKPSIAGSGVQPPKRWIRLDPKEEPVRSGLTLFGYIGLAPSTLRGGDPAPLLLGPFLGHPGYPLGRDLRSYSDRGHTA